MREAAKELGYQPDETFCLKISQLREIFEVRWSVFLLGPAGCGKTAIWKTLMHAQQSFGEKTVYKPINPKVKTERTNIFPMLASSYWDQTFLRLHLTHAEWSSKSGLAGRILVMNCNWGLKKRNFCLPCLSLQASSILSYLSNLTF